MPTLAHGKASSLTLVQGRQGFESQSCMAIICLIGHHKDDTAGFMGEGFGASIPPRYAPTCDFCLSETATRATLFSETSFPRSLRDIKPLQSMNKAPNSDGLWEIFRRKKSVTSLNYAAASSSRQPYVQLHGAGRLCFEQAPGP